MRSIVALFLLVAMPATALAGDRPVTFCLADGEGGHAERGRIHVWSEQLEIPRDNENAFKTDETGCVEIPALQWNGVPFPLKAWVTIDYEATAPGFYPAKGSVRIDKKKKANTRSVMMERKAP